MPLVRIKSDLHFFAHVPRAAGGSVEAYLTTRFGTLALLDDSFPDQPLNQRWSQTSPQHIDVATLQRFFPADWIASSFAVVRHPVTRIVSAFHHQAEVIGTVPKGMDVNEWLIEWFESVESDPYLNDNHLRRQSEFVPANAVIFHVEHGLDGLVEHLDTLAGEMSGPRNIDTEASRKTEGKRDATLTERSLTLIEEYYADDFARFGYDADEPLPGLIEGTPAQRSGFFGRLRKAG
ncbi:MAG: sulfotransferase family 2 domain-containing protein [Deltaproteobacteria bacterium]